jgi:hypothetical protein
MCRRYRKPLFGALIYPRSGDAWSEKLFVTEYESLSRCLNMVTVADLDDPSSMSEIARAEFGITKSLPRSVVDAFGYLSDDKELVDVLGERFVKSYLSVKKVRFK